LTQQQAQSEPHLLNPCSSTLTLAQVLFNQHTISAADAAKRKAQLTAEAALRKVLQDELFSLKLERARAVRDAEASSMHSRNLTDEIDNLKFAVRQSDDVSKSVTEEAERLKCVAAARELEVQRLAPFEPRVALLALDIESLKIEV
jgi:hypothetical protein